MVSDERNTGRSTRPLVALTTLLMALGAHRAASIEARPADRSETALYANELEYCVVETNQYRASIGRPALTRSVELEAYAAAAAPHDTKARKAHHYFRKTSGGGVAFAENQIPAWPLPRFGSVREIIRSGLAMMWAEGRGGGHYDNLAGRYTQVGCGVFVQNDRVTVVQAFR
jgi:hypothetical protein